MLNCYYCYVSNTDIYKFIFEEMTNRETLLIDKFSMDENIATTALCRFSSRVKTSKKLDRCFPKFWNVEITAKKYERHSTKK